ncbi:Trifunctional purine biosynthetic protein adenosine-3 [Trichoplax sp. H2]|nr:Trifunctional purine biosynthetic protein adenosine-3 [Trichoplax sp. H2]|eukprot:RDD39091.1 Trifunctional purine biosynthetic protein adenosine-3 [Trichoplax sp. H2]
MPSARFIVTLLLICVFDIQSFTLALQWQQRQSSILYLKNYEYAEFSGYSKVATNTSDIKTNLAYRFRIQVHAYKKTFPLVLRSQPLLYHDNFILDLDPNSVKLFDHHHLVQGFVESYPTSEAYGYIYPSGQFQGVFIHNKIKYYIEYSLFYIRNLIDRNSFIIYRDVDIQHRSRKGRGEAESGPWLFDPLESFSSSNLHSHLLRKKKFSEQTKKDTNKTTCLARIEIDHRVVQRYGDQFHALIGASVLLQGVNLIYRRTDFNGDGKADGIGFAVQSFSAKRNFSRLDNIDDPKYYFGNWTALYNYSSYCMAFLLIDHQFTLKVTGIASSGYEADQGVCTRYHYQYNHLRSSSNVGLMSISRYRSSLIYPIRLLIMAHEMGHIFGANHDNASHRCSSGGSHGDYLMHSTVTSGKQRNNLLFSPCSRQSIYHTLLNKARSQQSCFVDQYYPVCGNGIIDDGEECDCGYQNHCQDPTCTPAYLSYLDIPNQLANFAHIPCRKIPNYGRINFVSPAVIMGITLITCLAIVVVASVFWNYIKPRNPFRSNRFYSEHQQSRYVIKANGLAAGKGIAICCSQEEAETAIIDILIVLAFCDGVNVSIMPHIHDYKRLYDGDLGPITGGMRVFAPYTKISDDDDRCIGEEIIFKIISKMKSLGHPYDGILYVDIMLTNDGPKVLEFNCRLGNPEAQVLLPLLKSDLFNILEDCIKQNLNRIVEWHPDYVVGVVLASRGYPRPYQTDVEIHSINKAATFTGIQIFHAETALTDDMDHQVLTKKGGVLTATAKASSLSKASIIAYRTIDCINFDAIKSCC